MNNRLKCKPEKNHSAEKFAKANHFAAAHSSIKKIMNNTPLWLLFTSIVSFLMLILTIMLSYSTYAWSTQNAINTQNSTTRQLIDLKAQNIDQYLNNLSNFCVLPVYDSSLYNDLLTKEPLAKDQLSYVQSAISGYYYTRSDLTTYQIYLLNQSLCIGRDAGEQHMKISKVFGIRNDEKYLSCLDSSSGYALFPSENSSSLFTFCHTIIKINDKTPCALVCTDVNKSLMSGSFKNQIAILYNSKGQVLYTNTKSDLAETINTSDISSFSQKSKKGIIKLDGESYLYASNDSEQSELRLAVLTPLSSITDRMVRIRIFTIFQGIIFMVISMAITFFVIRYLTAPLSELADSQLQMGSGNFHKIKIGRCRETKNLRDSFNEMSERIEKLINENLLSKINEQGAQLTALEAQINPHFLFNTLQAIGSEALMNDQTKIYTMITELASNLRYTIKAPNEVTLKQDLDFTQNYIDLQKMRMDDRLTVTQHIDSSLYNTIIPKCTIQPVVENAIKYGISGDISSITIDIDISVAKEILTIKIYDDGYGMSPEKLEEVNSLIHSYIPGKESSEIGLANLYSRLMIMYNKKVELIIESNNENNHHTCVTILLDISGEGR